MDGLLRTRRFRIFRVVGIDVYVHWTLLAVFAYTFLTNLQNLTWAAEVSAIIFVSVLLHEFGHCFGARRMGGQADEIVMWPLGGLALCDAPMNPWAQFVTTACGPLVTGLLVLVGLGAEAIAKTPDFTARHGYMPWDVSAAIFGLNLSLLIFNVLPAFPLDGGRMFQELLWFRKGYQRSLRIALYVGFPFAVGFIAAGFFKLWGFGIISACIGFWNLTTCYEHLQLLNAGAFAEYDEPWRSPYARNEWQVDARPGLIRGWLERRRQIRARRAAEREEQLARLAAEREAMRSQRLDDILRKLSQVGREGLTPDEKAFLEFESERLRAEKRKD